MSELRKYVRKSGTTVTAVQIDLVTSGFEYEKWGGIQRAQAGDWLVDNAGEVYTVNRESFERTYRRISPGVYEKIAPVWARVAEEAGRIPTHEGATDYARGDMLVFNDPAGEDGYAMKAAAFRAMYKQAE